MTARAQRPPAKRALALIQAEPWAITREALAQIVQIAARENRSLEAIEAETGQPLEHTYEATIREGIATIYLTGPLFRYANLFTRISGATAHEMVAQDLTAALHNPAVRGILLAIDSPGGAVSGTSELGELIYAARSVKPLVAHIDGLGASGAYWLASAAERVTASDTSLIGSIGVVMAEHLDDDSNVIEFVSSQSPMKRTSPTEELGRAQRQAIVDALAERFLEAVARHRGVPVDQVRADFGQGDLFVGAAAVEAGLIDEISTYEQVHAALVEETSAAMVRDLGASRWAASASRGLPALNGGRSAPTTESPMATKIQQANVRAAAKAEDAEDEDDKKKKKDDEDAGDAKALSTTQVAERYPEAAAALRTEGATAERTRILDIEALAIAGHEQLIAEAKADPTATAETTAVKLIQAQRANPAQPAAPAEPGKKHLANMAGDEATANPPSAQVAKGEAGAQETIASLVAMSSLRRANAAAN